MLKVFYRKLIKYPLFYLKNKFNKIIPRKQCYICKQKFFNFHPYKLGEKSRPPISQIFDVIGSDVENFGCPYCHSHDRERHLYMYFDKLNFWPKLKKNILHFSPELNLYKKIEGLNPLKYILADIEPNRYSFCDSIQKIDITDINYPDNFFDIIIANHILEHISDYKKAFIELHRVLKKGGIAILQTPYSALLHNNFEDKNINSDYLREKYYGERDHFRIFGDQFFNELNNLGLVSKIHDHKEFFSNKDAYYYGVNLKEPFMIFEKKY